MVEPVANKQNNKRLSKIGMVSGKFVCTGRPGSVSLLNQTLGKDKEACRCLRFPERQASASIVANEVYPRRDYC